MEPDGRPTNLIALRDAKQRGEQLISQRYAEDLIDGDELERRLEALGAADTLAAVDALTVDLLDPSSSAAGVASMVLAESARPQALAVPAKAASVTALVPADAVEPERRRVAVLSTMKEEGAWTPARTNRVVNVLGESKLDLREARLAPGELVFEVRCVLGSIKLLVPPGLAVRVEVSNVLSEVTRDPGVVDQPDSADAPVIVVRGSLVLSELEVRERLPGEGGWRAFWRKRRERRALRRRQRAALPPAKDDP